MISGEHGLFVVLHHHDRITDITKVLEGLDQLFVIRLVQADAGLIEDVENTGESCTELGRESDALALST